MYPEQIVIVINCSGKLVEGYMPGINDTKAVI